MTISHKYSFTHQDRSLYIPYITHRISYLVNALEDSEVICKIYYTWQYLINILHLTISHKYLFTHQVRSFNYDIIRHITQESLRVVYLNSLKKVVNLFLETILQSVPHHIGLSPRFNAEIISYYSKTLIFLHAHFYIRLIQFFKMIYSF